MLANARPDPTLAEYQTRPPDSGYSPPHRLPDFNHTYPIMAGLFDQQPTRARVCNVTGAETQSIPLQVCLFRWSMVVTHFDLVDVVEKQLY